LQQQDHCFVAICDVAIHTASFLEITLSLQQARDAIKIRLARTHTNCLIVTWGSTVLGFEFDPRRTVQRNLHFHKLDCHPNNI